MLWRDLGYANNNQLSQFLNFIHFQTKITTFQEAFITKSLQNMHLHAHQYQSNANHKPIPIPIYNLDKLKGPFLQPQIHCGHRYKSMHVDGWEPGQAEL